MKTVFPILAIIAVVALGVAADDELVLRASIISKANALCPDQSSSCPYGSTCCKRDDGRYGCCSYADATCCSDNLHCCPNGYQCDTRKETCVKAINNDTLPWAKKLPAVISVPAEDPPSTKLTCLDRSTCPGLSACCRTYSGSYRCCTYPTNVCCADGFHCCMRGSICDATNMRCLPGTETLPWQSLAVAKPTSSQPAL